MKFLGIIPARYASTRFPGKPLTVIGGKSMIQRVYEQSVMAIETVVVATDDIRIYEAVKAFGGRVVMTSTEHLTGTDRIAEATNLVANKDKVNYDVILNIQGDEPFIRPEQLKLLMDCFSEPTIQIATLIKPIEDSESLFDPNRPKVIINTNEEAIYFSRSVIPYVRKSEQSDWLKQHKFYQHIGLYAFRKDILLKITQLPMSSLEVAESLEQVRWIENGYRIKVAVTSHETYAVDSPEDLEKIKSLGLF